jgi:hypothetical protein
MDGGSEFKAKRLLGRGRLLREEFERGYQSCHRNRNGAREKDEPSWTIGTERSFEAEVFQALLAPGVAGQYGGVSPGLNNRKEVGKSPVFVVEQDRCTECRLPSGLGQEELKLQRVPGPREHGRSRAIVNGGVLSLRVYKEGDTTDRW